jgi:hypothetical protein
METKMNRRVVKESVIPLQVLYNDTVDRIKFSEKIECKDPRPVVFSAKKDPKTKKQVIRFELLG